MKNFIAVLFLAFCGLGFIGWIYQEMHYRYRITVPNGEYTRTYYTNAYHQRSGCVSFQEGEARDSSQLCGMYTITLLR